MKGLPSGPRDRTLAAAFLLLLFFATPFVHLWASAALPWYLPYLLWGAVIALAAWPGRRQP